MIHTQPTQYFLTPNFFYVKNPFDILHFTLPSLLRIWYKLCIFESVAFQKKGAGERKTLATHFNSNVCMLFFVSKKYHMNTHEKTENYWGISLNNQLKQYEGWYYNIEIKNNILKIPENESW